MFRRLLGAALDLVCDKENGFIVPFDRSDDFVKITRELISNRDLLRSIGVAARATIVRERRWSQTKASLSELYDTAIKNFQMRQVKCLPGGTRSNAVAVHSSSLDGETKETLDAFGPRTRRWINACEYVRGTKMLIQLGEWRRALQFVGLAIKEAPRDFSIWSQFMSIFLREGKKKLFRRRVGRSRPNET